MKTGRLLIFDSHPVQYKAPVYREIAKHLGDDLRVIYATDCTLRGHHDAGFGCKVTWDVPLLAGYPHEILNCEKGEPLKGFFSLQSWAVFRLIREFRPTLILLSQMTYLYDIQVLLSAWMLGVPVYFRVETQDEANERTAWRSFVRGIAFRGVYAWLSGAFWIGRLNRAHLVAHGFGSKPLIWAPYCVDGELMTLTDGEADARRVAMRGQLGLSPDTVCVGFFGKLIPKKDPELLLRMGAAMNAEEKRRTTFLFVGSGELEIKLCAMANACGLKALFAGFVNQKIIPDYYLATDIVMLPSRRMGETWGLVVNEALAAGCRVIVSDAVGCHAEFKALPTVRVIPVGSVDAAIRKFRELVVDIRATVRLRNLPSVFTKEVVSRQITSAVNRRGFII